MIKRYRKEIGEMESLPEILNVMVSDKKYQKHLLGYMKAPYDAKFYSIENGLFNIAVSTPKTPALNKADSEDDFGRLISNITARLVCSGSNYVGTTNIDDLRVGIMGIVDEEGDKTPMAFQKKGDTIYLLGYYYEDPFDEKAEQTLSVIRKSIKRGYINSAHAITSNGLLLALLESCLPNQLGFDITTDAEVEDKEFFFDYSKYLILISVDEETENDLVEYLYRYNIPIFLLGHVTKGDMRSDSDYFGDIKSVIKKLGQ